MASAVVTDRVYQYSTHDDRTSDYIGPVEAIIGSCRATSIGRQRGLGLDRPDLCPPGHDRPRRRRGSSVSAMMAYRHPDTTAFTAPIPSPVVSLTIQAALPGTLLADGETIPSPASRSSSRCSMTDAERQGDA